MKVVDFLLCVVVLAYIGAGIGFPCYIIGLQNSMNDCPGWASTAAHELSEEGGAILYYVSDPSTGETIEKYVITTEDKIYADKFGFRIYHNSNFKFIPYDRFAGIEVGT